MTALRLSALLFGSLLLLTSACAPTTNDLGDDDDDSAAGDDDDDSTEAVSNNSWPASPNPDYVGEGFEEGMQTMNFQGVDQFGDPVDLHQFLGHMILIDYSAVWCGPCNAAAAEAEELYEFLRDSYGVPFVMIHALVDDATPGDPRATGADAASWASAYGLTFPVIAGEEVALHSNSMGVQYLPTFFILGADLTIHDMWSSERSRYFIGDRILELWNTHYAE